MIFHQGRVQAVNNQGTRTFFFRFQNADDSVGIPHRRDFRIGHNQHAVCRGNGILKTSFDTSGGIDQHKVKIITQVFDQTVHVAG